TAVLIGMKTQFIAVVERRRDLAILKAMGQTNRILLAQILTESGLLSFIGGVGGCLIGAILLAAVPFGQFMRFPTADLIAVPPLVLGASPLFSLFGGLVAGIFPALSAAGQDPAEVLRRI
ncbi:MAG: FtsX-like permease family protein, partial [Candidatus Aminicenantes bacterium]|nr:FtsX-like permease family protein [Candidatus Aminicenantes bacterium]